MKKVIKIAGIALAAAAGALAAWAAIVFRMTFGLATKKQMARLTDEEHNDPEMLRQIEEGRTWFLAQHVRSVSVTSFDGLLLKGHYLAHPQAKRTIVAFHGFKTHALFDFGATARFYYENDCNLLLVEQRSHLISEGDHIDLGILTRRDVATWVNYVNSINDPSLPVILLGVSMGAATVMMAQEFPLPSNVKGIIDDCGFSDTWQEVRRFGEVYHIRPITLLMPLLNLLCKLHMGIDLHEASPKKALEHARLPILMIHGTADELVPIRNSYENYEACTAPKRLIEVEGADHIESFFTEPERYKQEVLDFFERIGA